MYVFYVFVCACHLCVYVRVCINVWFHSAGNICMFKSNEAFKLSVDQGQGGIITAIDNIQTFITDVPQVGGQRFKASRLISFNPWIQWVACCHMQRAKVFDIRFCVCQVPEWAITILIDVLFR